MSDEARDPVPRASAGAADAQASDGSLLARFRAGQDDAATELYHRYVERLRRLVSNQFSPRLAARLDAEDIVQSAFGSFFRVAKAGIYNVPGGEELWKLLLTIALNKMRSQGTFHNAAKRDVRVTTPLEDDAAAAKGDDVAETHLRIVLDEALTSLPPLHRQMVELRLRGYEIAEIAQQAGRAKRTAERVLQQALAKLTSLFAKEE
jgi:RNA polymerase sigma-70 factor (ECF subfamily)